MIDVIPARAEKWHREVPLTNRRMKIQLVTYAVAAQMLGIANGPWIAGAIEALLTAIDNQDWDSLSKLLCDDTVYEVSGFPRFDGKQAVMDYYEKIRPILSSTHTIKSIVTVLDKIGLSFQIAVR